MTLPIPLRSLRPCVGIDPGTIDGAAVLLDVDGRTVRSWCVWWSRGSGMVTSTHQGFVDGVADEAHAVALWRSSWEVDAFDLVVEDQRAFPGMANHQALLTLAFSAGLVTQAARRGARSLRRVESKAWRSTVLGIPRNSRTKAKAAEKRAIANAPTLFSWRSGWPTRLPQAAQGALAEAACIARWGVVVREGAS